MRTLVFSIAALALACGSTSPSDVVVPRYEVELVAKLSTSAGDPVAGARTVIKTWPAADGETDLTFTGFLTSDADGVARRTAGRFGGRVLDSVEVYANPPSICFWDPVQKKIHAIHLDTVPAGVLEIAVELPDALESVRTEVGVFCAQGTEQPLSTGSAGRLSYNLVLEIQEVGRNGFAGRWRLGLYSNSPAEGDFTAIIDNGLVAMLLTLTEDNPFCNEVRLYGTIDSGGIWSPMDVVTDLKLPGWPCIPDGHRYRFVR